VYGDVEKPARMAPGAAVIEDVGVLEDIVAQHVLHLEAGEKPQKCEVRHVGLTACGP
jgi:hypothetical protein